MLYYSSANIKGKKQKKNPDLNKSSSSKLNNLYNQLDKSNNDNDLNNNHNNNNNNNSNLVNKNFINKTNQSTSIFSPHNSVFQALQNPDLNIGFDLNEINNNTIDNDNNVDSEIEIDNENDNDDDHYKNNEFSITSWQSISDDQHPDSNNNNLPYQFSSNNNSNIISTNNSPFLKYSEFHNYNNLNNNIINNTNNNSPNRNNSPNVASILSSSSDHDYQNLTDNNINQNDVDIEITNNNYNDENIIKLTRDALISSGIAILDSDCDSVTDDDEYTVDSSTIIPSFVMPRVSIPSLLKMDYSKSINRVNNNSINIQIIGYDNQILINRFKCYKKTLRNINFYNRIQNNVNINLSLLIVSEENFLLPELTKIPCIPIVFQNQSGAISVNNYLQKIPKHLLVCKPIVLESLNDDLMILIDFLSNINNNIISWNKLLNDINLDGSLNLNNLNSILIEKNSSIENSSSIFSNSLNKSSIINKKIENDTEITDKKDNGFLKTKLIAGLTIGILSLTVIIVWKNLSTVKNNNNSVQLQSKNNKSNLVISLSKKNLIPETESYNSSLSFDQLVFLKLKSLTEKLESWSKLLLSSGLMIIERTKLTLVQLISLSN